MIIPSAEMLLEILLHKRYSDFILKRFLICGFFCVLQEHKNNHIRMLKYCLLFSFSHLIVKQD